MAAANVLGYVAIVVVSVAFGPAAFGAVGALTSLGVIAGIPAGTVMVIVAARVGRDESSAWAYGTCTIVGAAEAILLVVASPILVRVLHLESVWPLVWLALSLVPATLFAAQQGLLLGTRRPGRLSLLFCVSGITRVMAAVACVVIHPTASVVYAAWLIASIVTVLVGARLTRGLPPLHGELGRLRVQLATLTKASFALLALISLTSVDTIFARHLLSAEDSGIYSVASIFAKVVFWGTQFIAMVMVPKLATQGRHLVMLKAYVTVLIVSAPVLLVIAINPLLWLTSVGLDDYSAAADLLVKFAVLGILWSLVQVAIFADMGSSKIYASVVVWLGLALQTGLTFTVLGSSPTDIFWAATIAASLVNAAILGRTLLVGGVRRLVRSKGAEMAIPVDTMQSCQQP